MMNGSGKLKISAPLGTSVIPVADSPEELAELRRERRITEDALEELEMLGPETPSQTFPIDDTTQAGQGVKRRDENEPPSEFPAREAQTLPGKVIREAVGPFARFVRAVSSGPQAVVALAIIAGVVYLARIWLLK